LTGRIRRRNVDQRDYHEASAQGKKRKKIVVLAKSVSRDSSENSTLQKGKKTALVRRRRTEPQSARQKTRG